MGKNGFEIIKGHQPLHGEIQKGCPYYDRCEMKFDRCKDERPELIDLGEIYNFFDIKNVNEVK